MAEQKKKLSIILTFYNEEDCINSSIDEITQNLNQIEIRKIFCLLLQNI